MSWGLFLSCDHAAVWTVLSVPMAVHMSLHLAHLFNMSQVSYHHEIAKSHHHWQKWCPCSDKFQRSKVKLTYVKNVPILPFLDCNSNFNLQMSKKLCAKLEVSCCLSRSSVKFQAHMGKKKFFLVLAFLDCNFSLNSQMATEQCTSLKGQRKGALIFSRSLEP